MNDLVEKIKAQVLAEIQINNINFAVRVGVSNRHLHVSKADFQTLFGQGETLTELKPLSQVGQFAAHETVTIEANGKQIQDVRILGPYRKETQVEISATDARFFKLNPPVRNSGDLEGSLGIRIYGPKGSIDIKKGLIIATRHIHFSDEEAKRFGVTNNQRVKVRVSTDKGGIMHGVYCKVDPSYSLEMHLDTDDANAMLIKTGDVVEVIL
jgi:putative phosphotransacetylase